MRILFYCWKAYNQADIISALRRRGHTVDTFELELGNFEVDENFTGRFIDKLFNGEENTACSNVPEAREHECNERGTAEKLGNVYDAVFSVNYFPIISDICEQFSETGIKYICWTCDSPLSTMYHQSIFNKCNYIFIFDKFCYMEFKERGANVFYLPLAAAVERADEALGHQYDIINNSIYHGVVDRECKEQKALRITSQTTGSHKGSPTQFRITEGNTNHLTGAVKLYGLDNIDSYPSNAVFDLNGRSTISENNSFLVDGCYEVTLHGTSAEYGEGKVTAMKDGSVLLDEYNKLADNYNRFLELSNSKDTHELRMLRSTITSTVKRYRQTLESNGFTVNDDNTLSVDSDSLTASAKSGSIFDNLNNLSTFKDALRKRINNIEINPMEYINKKVVAYKNPHKLISSTYSTSIYTGMMFDRSL
jgi:ElaB/YqjD/DUF883 family membrane-anchored ribosome-binding protein